MAVTALTRSRRPSACAYFLHMRHTTNTVRHATHIFEISTLESCICWKKCFLQLCVQITAILRPVYVSCELDSAWTCGIVLHYWPDLDMHVDSMFYFRVHMECWPTVKSRWCECSYFQCVSCVSDRVWCVCHEQRKASRFAVQGRNTHTRTHTLTNMHTTHTHTNTHTYKHTRTHTHTCTHMCVCVCVYVCVRVRVCVCVCIYIYVFSANRRKTTQIHNTLFHLS